MASGVGSSRARRQVASYFAAVGLPPSPRLTAVVDSIVSGAGRDAKHVPATAVADAQARVQRFLGDVFGDRADHLDPVRVRAFLGQAGRMFPDDVADARALARHHEELLSAGQLYEHFRDQPLEHGRTPRWLLGLLVPVALTVAAALVFGLALAADGMLAIELLWLLLFVFAFLLCSIGLFTACLGFVRGVRRRPPAPLPPATGALPRTAVLMPVYHEDPDQVFGAVAAMREDLAHRPEAAAFEFFVLSDSHDPAKVLDEERALRWARADDSAATPATIPLYYRRRLRNVGKKSGNLANFFERWGERYVYAIVLDADSLMRAEAMVRMVRRMEAEPRLGLLQAGLDIHHARTLFARSQQFVSSCVGRMFNRGLAAWADDEANYYGHNAVIRVSAFLECCALPELQGRPPLGGQILSHDFVEAAMLCREGWAVRIADDVDGSWEEFPPTLPQYVARDRRWCQGEMQHLRILLVAGFKPMSRVHLAVGASSYLAGLAWLLFLVTGLLVTATGSASRVSPEISIILLVATLIALLGPRLLGWLGVVADRTASAAHGGRVRLTVSLVLEMILAALLAPLLMVHQARAVLGVITGRTVQWGPQRRRAGDSRWAIARGEVIATVIGAGFLALIVWAAPDLLWWLAPVWIPLLLAMPIAVVASSVGLGLWLARLRLLQVPAESHPDPVDRRAEELRAAGHAREGWRQFRDIVLDPVFLAAHCATLPGNGAAAPPPQEVLIAARERARRLGPAELTVDDRQLLASDAESMRWLHLHAWRTWSVDSWEPVMPPEAVPA